MLIMDYLQQVGFMHTASVFAPESGIQQYIGGGGGGGGGGNKFVESFLDLLHLHPDNKLYQVIQRAPQGSCALSTLLEHIMRTSMQPQHTRNADCQTVTMELATFDRKMELINERYRGMASENALTPVKTLEEKLAKFQKEADERVKVEVEEAVARVSSACFPPAQ